jgi:hypothetical protein
MTTRYHTATSLDGFIAIDDDSLDGLFPLVDINDTGCPAFIARVGGEGAGQFHGAGLLDEANLQGASVTPGRGKPLFPRRVTDPPWQLLSARPIGPGFAGLRCKRPSLSHSHSDSDSDRQR